VTCRQSSIANSSNKKMIQPCIGFCLANHNSTINPGKLVRWSCPCERSAVDRESWQAGKLANTSSSQKASRNTPYWEMVLAPTKRSFHFRHSLAAVPCFLSTDPLKVGILLLRECKTTVLGHQSLRSGCSWPKG